MSTGGIHPTDATTRTTLQIVEPGMDTEKYRVGQPDTDIVGTGDTVFEAIKDFVSTVEGEADV